MSTHSPAAAPAASKHTERAQAVLAFIAEAKRLAPDSARATPDQLRQVAERLEALGRRRDLFPPEAFSVVPGRPASIYRLAEDADGGYALYLSLGEPGKAQPPHDHTTWAIIAGVAGVERNEVYARRKSADPARDTLAHARRVDVGPGQSIVLGPDDVHTIELVGDEPGAHLHFYGLALDRLPGRVVFESAQGGSYRTFSPPAAIFHARVSPQALQDELRGEAEIAVLDVREAGRYARRHLLHAAPAPLWRLELLADRLVPRRGTRIVLVDDDETLAHQAAAKLARLGWTDIAVLAGGTDGWEREGRELFSGTNVPSKAFGEVIEHEKHTPWIDVDELHERVARGDDIVVVDSRTPEEFHNFTLPFSHSLPGAELVYRIRELAPDPDTFVVVNCAGRTRSIVGAQTLIDAGIPNRVASLRNGTMEWLLSGRELAYGRQAALPEPDAQSLEAARAQARNVAERAGIGYIDAATLRAFEAEQDARTLYRFDVRTREEYEAGHLEGWRWAPGGQLVQATDEYLATRRARVVLADWDGVRALTTGAWLAQLGAVEVYLYQPPALAPRQTGPEPRRVLRHRPEAGALRAEALRIALDAQAADVFDVESRGAYERGHVPGARFAAPDRLAEFLPADTARVIVLTSSDGVLAGAVAAELAWRTGRPVRYLLGGTRAWAAQGLPLATGAQGVLTGDDDQSISPYLFEDLAARDQGFREYLDWELGLVAQLEREGSEDIRLIAQA
ncbi:molybdopterin biosynthesis protein MoeB [Achromobacter denitrificans]|uniref:rhodanese-like domain-containing protein n=1 Tax=Achromobacter denitrificans TaxID=32002 RepID=UPI000787E0BB|nr:rhodanese-like domain-containing protein [Achromobacter denitrificans]OLU05040.1 rhodanese [Achromobacter denitrificans]QKH41035.1 rhodanese [Achromobacter denitrificans]QKH51819.1 rhodanese [Achromobacter denitrificans]CAB3715166.1 Thiosulfate sulfurtransferase GlpE [Achromobacter denitrificans]SUU28436.1 molybdopterin biosynthesis protein MoeB [Achromobacter denitrificans]